ncbi:hypothetical protein ABNQ39_20585 [Azospirillum sp. A26]|uniref:hypothetical protein n=1 Tax=Azospirillum sp. A26 TaxID=3160607 RepID=UPI00366A66D9
MDGTKLQAKVYGGYAKAAQRIGLPFDVYRPSDATDPLATGNKVVTALPAHFTADGNYTKPNTYGQATWQAMVDGSQVAVGDYLTGDPGTFFIAAKQPLLPILAVGCNRTVSLTQGGTSPVAVGWPASILVESPRGDLPLEDVAGNPANPSWRVLLPAVTSVQIDVADLLTDELLRQYIINSAELTDLGWRISAVQTTLLTDSVIHHYATVIRLIGKTVTLRKQTKSGGANPVITNTDYSVKALIAGYDANLINGTTITVKDLRVIVGTKDVNGNAIPTPAPADWQVIIDSAAPRSVVTVKPEYAGDVVAVYEIQSRG